MGTRMTGTAVVAALALALGGCGAADRDALRRLPVGGSGATAEAGSGRSAGAPADLALLRPVEYRLEGSLPDLASSSAAYELPATVGSTAVERLGRALGLSGRAERSGGTWLLAEGDRRLSVDGFSGAPWYYASDLTATSRACAEARRPAEAPEAPASAEPGAEPGPEALPYEQPYEPCPEPAPPADLPSKGEAERLAQGFFDRAGVDLGEARVRTEQDTRQGWRVSFEPVVGGLPVAGLEHSVTLGSKGEIVWASGFLARPDEVGDYPLVGAAKGFERLADSFGAGAGWGPRPLVGGAEPAIAYDADCAASSASCQVPHTEPVVHTVTGVELVLMQVSPGCPGEKGYLVPAYRFTGAGGGFGPVVPAVEEDHLVPADRRGGPPAEGCPRSGSRGGPGASKDEPVTSGGGGGAGSLTPPDAGSRGGEPGATEPAPPPDLGWRPPGG